MLLQAAGHSYEEITEATGASERKIRRDITSGRSKLTELVRRDPAARGHDPAVLLQAARAPRVELILTRRRARRAARPAPGQCHRDHPRAGC